MTGKHPDSNAAGNGSDSRLLSGTNQDWLAGFRRAHGRSPVVLHIGNIANNAYNLAKLLNQAGLDNDVICYDYYHAMGCPEWEEADLAGDYGDQLRPDWLKAGIGDFERPRWFAQGPMSTCIAYLRAKRGGDPAHAESLWAELCLEGRVPLPEARAGAAPGERPEFRPSRARHRPFLRFFIRQRRFLRRLHALLMTMVSGRSLSTRIAAVSDYAEISAMTRNEFLRMAATWSILGVSLAVRLLGAPIYWLTLRLHGRLHARSARAMSALRQALAWAAGQLGPGPESAREQALRQADFEQTVRDVTARFKRAFPGRADPFTAGDAEPYRYVMPDWRALFARYDYVIAYATTPILPLLGKVQPYFAFEHGTLRSIPFEDTATGRGTAISYHLAGHVFVTNFDCVESAEQLAPGNYTLINHPYDEDHGLAVDGWLEQRAALCKRLDADLLFFFPTRQDWIAGTGYADKDNDVFLRAFAALRAHGVRVGLVCCAWGSNVEQSKALLKEKQVAEHVLWVDPMAIVPFERMARAAHCVVDQFRLGAFGGIVFKAMAVGAPVLTYLDEARVLRQYPECPPVINCRNEDEVVAAILKLARDPAGFEALGRESRQWIKRYHGKRQTVNAVVDAFRMRARRASSPFLPKMGATHD